ncbi:pilus assembly protein [Iamia majanohamensis]|uniref:Pilus assembly protein n=1 Tax=Iamia majanohamensis TaxID=467976 RepID=A0AAE9Y8Y2_9ACTN|nr:TadE/TadG family type IV pilus assembly protein [Iamia majanohamensis]WCO67951.1 pilus assembly protein [Iamia majanohamensis]
MRPPPRLRDDRGSIAVEVAIIAPALLFLMLLVVYAGKVSEAEGNVERAVSDAARAASLRQHPGDATDDAQASSVENLAAAGVPCLSLATTVDTADFGPGGTVTVTVRCEASMADVTLLGVPGRHTFTATATEVIDTYRSGS